MACEVGPMLRSHWERHRALAAMSWIIWASFWPILAPAEDKPLSPLHARARTGRDLHNLIVDQVRDATPIKLRELQTLPDRTPQLLQPGSWPARQLPRAATTPT